MWCNYNIDIRARASTRRAHTKKIILIKQRVNITRLKRVLINVAHEKKRVTHTVNVIICYPPLAIILQRCVLNFPLIVLFSV